MSLCGRLAGSRDIAIKRERNQAKLLGLLFHGHALREVTRFVDIAAKFDREMILEQLKRNGIQDRAEKLGHARKRDNVGSEVREFILRYCRW